MDISRELVDPCDGSCEPPSRLVHSRPSEESSFSRRLEAQEKKKIDNGYVLWQQYTGPQNKGPATEHYVCLLCVLPGHFSRNNPTATALSARSHRCGTVMTELLPWLIYAQGVAWIMALMRQGCSIFHMEVY